MKQSTILLLFLCCSCSVSRWDYARMLIHRFEQGVYVKDNESGLCYLLTDAQGGVNAACVPCDSLRGVKVVPVRVTGVGAKIN